MRSFRELNVNLSQRRPISRGKQREKKSFDSDKNYRSFQLEAQSQLYLSVRETSICSKKRFFLPVCTDRAIPCNVPCWHGVGSRNGENEKAEPRSMVVS